MDKIESFKGEYKYLSNFYTWPVVLDNVCYPSNENAYQAAKTLIKKERIPFETCTAGEAKAYGKPMGMGGIITLRKDWEKVKVHIMWTLIDQKFSASPLREMLLATGDAELIEGNWWGDVYWGICKGEGMNKLGKLLMAKRLSLKQKKTIKFENIVV